MAKNTEYGNSRGKGITAPKRHLEGGHPDNYDVGALNQNASSKLNSNGAKGTYKSGQLKHPVTGESLETNKG